MNTEKLLSYGFTEKDGTYIYTVRLGVGMLMTVRVAEDKIYTEVTDNGEEYTLHLVPDAQGSFVGRVRAEYDAVLEDITLKCFDKEVFKNSQTKEIIAYIRDSYGDELEFLWQKFPDNAVVRRSDNKKWYATILTVSRRKLGFQSDENTEIIDLRISPEAMTETVDNVRYFPGYHMNKKHWITICLDGTVPTEEICRRIDDSYILAIKCKVQNSKCKINES